MKSFASEGSIQRIEGHRGLSYRPEFKEWINEHPGVMSKVAKAIEGISNERSNDSIGESIERSSEYSIEDDIRVTHIPQPYSDVFEVTVGEDKFFVKRDAFRMKQGRKTDVVGGQSEYTDTLIAKVDLGEDPDIEVIDFQLGYTNHDKENPVAYFVSKWEDLKTADKYLDEPDLSEEQRNELIEKINRAMRLFGIYHDIKPENMFYDPITKKIKMFDLNIKPYERF